MSDPLVIDVQETPNPNAVKWTLNRVVSQNGRTYRDAASADAAWVKELLEIKGVQQVFALHNFVSITRMPGVDWEVILPPVEAVLRRSFE